MGESMEYADGSVFFDPVDADIARMNAERVSRLDDTLPKIIVAAEKAQQAAHDPDRWPRVCEHIAEVRRLLVTLKDDLETLFSGETPI